MNCSGAIQVVAEDEIPKNVKQKQGIPLTEAQIASVLRNYRSAPLGMVQEEQEFRKSIAGVQKKTALLWHDNTWCHPVGTTPIASIP